MSWASVMTRPSKHVALGPPTITPATVDFSRLVSLDFETYYDADYTLNKLSTSEYIRDPRFEVLMCGLKVGNKPTEIIPGPQLKTRLAKINWATHTLLCHNMQFDGFILSHHFKIKPSYTYCSLSMARGLHSSDIGAGLNEVSIFYGGKGKIEGGVEDMKGVHFAELFKNKPLWKRSSAYCMNDVDEMLRVFKLMHPKMPVDEMGLIHLTNRMFIDPVLKVDIPRVQKEYDREVAERKALLMSVINPADYEHEIKSILKNKDERALTGDDRTILIAKRVVGSSERFANLLRAEGIEPPVKLSAAWMKKDVAERNDADKWTYAFAKDDADFINLPDDVDALGAGLNLNKKADIKKLAARQDRLRLLVDTRLAVKSTTNITRAERFLKAGANGMRLPVGYAYARAHTLRWGGNNKMNMQNLTRGGELRQSILAEDGSVICVVDSGQIEARVNAELWGQRDLLDAFRAADLWDKKTMGVARGDDRDAYCKFADLIYNREITTNDSTERFVGKVCVLGLGYQMGAPKLQITLAKGALGGPPVYFELDKCQLIIAAYRRKNAKIKNGWDICKGIIEDMAAGRSGSHGPISWGKETVYLPSGMTLKYPKLRKRLNAQGWDEWTYEALLKGTPYRKKIYGGLLCENLVQALARIIIGEQMLEIDKFARVVMTTHDEIAATVKKALAETTMKRMYKVMKTPPKWWPNIPLNCEGSYATYYSK